MNAPFRTASGGRIDRSRTLRFTFDGQTYAGCAGDTLASALLANGIHLAGRSFKYHRPRGILAAGAEEPNALVRVGAGESRSTPNLRATQVEIYEGLTAESQNRWPSLRFDLGALNDLAAPFLPAGFYYKTFMWPRWAWQRWYEPVIRSMAGLGRAPTAPDADSYAQRYAHCDVLVIGAGPAGLAAALAASGAGRRVILCDEQAEFGGSLLSTAESPFVAHAATALSQSPNVTLLNRTTAFGMFAQNFVALAERVADHIANPAATSPRERLWQVRARQIVLATGAIERPMVFPGNDRPGIMLAGAARTYLHRFGVLAGKRAVLVTNCDSGYGAALDLAASGVRVEAIADSRAAPGEAVANAARAAGLTILPAATVMATQGRLRVRSVTLASAPGNRVQKIACDLVLMSGGHTPSIHLLSQARGTLRFDPASGAYVPDGDLGGLVCAGACRGLSGLEQAIEDGREAGRIASNRLAPGNRAPAQRTPVAKNAGAAAPAKPPQHGRAFADFQNDVTTKDLALAVREGFVSVEHVKRYTTVGMATDQGKTSNINALELVADARGSTMSAVGLTTFRMPYTPVTFGTLAGAARGDLFDPVRQTPLHGWADNHGAVFEDVGLWKRARYFPGPGETMAHSVARECRAVRQAAGIFDASTLGKIEVTGPDAAIFLERIYVNGIRKLALGRCRYGVMLGEDGFILDDGIIGRLAADRFHVTTTTGGAARVLAIMEDYLQTEWPELRVWLTSVTEEWATIAIQGPLARDMIAPFVQGIDLSPISMPHMSLRQGRVGGVETRLFRVSFSGEFGFEVNVPADYAQAVWNILWESGQQHGLTAYGTETMHVLRAEKGYIIVGQETDGTVTPDDAGLGWAIDTKKGDFVGKRSLARAAMADPGRKQLVGLLTEDPSIVLEEGAQIVAEAQGSIPRDMLGHVTSAYFSATLGRSIALAMVSAGRARMNTDVFVPMPDCTVRARVVAPVFHDPEGACQHG
jgi:sarcosine oxidase subunit alpha